MKQPDSVATDVVGNDDDKGTAMFEGWLTDTVTIELPFSKPDAAGKRPAKVYRRLYTRRDFLEWLQIEDDDILAQVPGSDRKLSGGASLIWVKREAKIERGQAGLAFEFESAAAATIHEDPTGAVYPPPRRGSAT